LILFFKIYLLQSKWYKFGTIFIESVLNKIQELVMEINLKNRSFLKLLDFKPEEILYLIELSSKLKKAKKAGLEEQLYLGKQLH